MKKILISIILLVSYFCPVFSQAENTSPTETQTLPVPKTINILLVPGHEPSTGGTEYKSLRERDMNVRVAQEIAKAFRGNSDYKIVIARDFYSWHPILNTYFKSQNSEIKKFIKEHSEIMNIAVKTGLVTKTNTTYHNKANSETALHLFGLNKIVSEQKADAVIHIHFNDYPGRKFNKPAKDKGFAIYVPEGQYKNSTSSNLLAKAIFPLINSYIGTSTLTQEKTGIVQDQDLIAIGSNNTLTKPSVLIEYGYIYEDIFSTKAKREIYYRNFGRATAEGIKKFFEDNPEIVFNHRQINNN